MRARLKLSGEIVDVVSFSPDGGYIKYINRTGLVLKRTFKNGQSLYDEFELIKEDRPCDDNIDWEQRRYEISRDILSALIYRNGYMSIYIEYAIEGADALIKELKKEKK